MKLSSAKISKESKGASPSHGGHHKNSFHSKRQSHHSILPLQPVDQLEQWSSVAVDMYNNSSSNNNDNNHHHHQPQTSHISTSRSSDYSAGGDGEPSATGNKWASRLLNESSYFLQALFCKATESGQRCFKTLTLVAEKSHCFDSARKLILKFQEVSPWTTFGHVAANGAILEALDGEPKLHIIDISNTLCTQWPTLLEALATRNDDTPHLKLTVVVTANIVRSMMKEISQRMEKFARLMGVPFEFNVISGLIHLGQLTKEALGVVEDEAVAVNCMGALRGVSVEERTAVIGMFRSLGPKVVTVVEEEADFSSKSFTPTSNEKLMLERECSRGIVRVLACDDDQDNEGDRERRERGSQWSERLKEAFSPVGFSDDVVDDVKALLKRYNPGWALAQPDQNETGLYLTWKEEPVVWVSAWKP
ncbi:hypothetical protein ES332_A10G166700v1 [Gossypium tomentosum]|uniref:Uncharacterized protein n=1 Tax=Gossypium tomentosum TaxID=34277 RepID=A0A5D2NS57_GOSTO|nr:hypothetical protein ES332_A10G166700v1 [Gossypium tomentosum]